MQFGVVDRQFVGFGFEQFIFCVEDVVEILFFELFVVNVFWKIVMGNVQLNMIVNVLQGNKRGFIYNMVGYYVVSNGDFDVQCFQFFVFFIVEFCV